MEDQGRLSCAFYELVEVTVAGSCAVMVTRIFDHQFLLAPELDESVGLQRHALD